MANADQKHNSLHPGLRLLVKLGSIVVHADEGTSPGGHQFDFVAMRQLLNDPEVKEWLAELGKMGLLPQRRA